MTTPATTALAAALLALLAPVTAAAQPTEDEASLVARGVALRMEGRDQEAFELFSRAWQTYPTPRVEAQLGLAAQALGRWVLAEEHLQAALLADQDGWIAQRRKVLQESLAVVRRRVGTLEVLANVDGAEVLVDGRGAGRLPLRAPLRLPAGTVVVQVQAQGHLPVQRTVTIAGGQLARETVQLVPLRATPPTPLPASPRPPPPSFALHTDLPPRPPPVPDRRHRLVLYTMIGAATAGAGLSLWSGLDTLAARDRYQAAPTEAGYRDGLGRQRRTNLLVIGTGVLSVVAVAWAIVGSRGTP